MTGPCRPSLSKLDEDASMKGFVAVPLGSSGRVRMIDSLGLTNGVAASNSPGASIEFGSIEDARTWVQKLNRDLPDITPEMDVPVELTHLPTEAVQQPNINAQVAAHLEHAIGHLEDGSQGLGIQARTLLAQGRLGEVANLYTQGLARFRPMSTLMAQIDDVLRGTGQDLGLAKDYTDLLRQHDMMVTYKAPYQQEIGTILSKVRESKATSGEWTRVYEIEDPAARMAAAAQAKFTPGETAALDEVDAFARKMFPETGLDPSRQIARYISHISERQSMGMGAKSWEDFPLDEVTQPFYEMYRNGQLNAREMDPRNLWSSYINALGWKKYLAEPYAQVAGKWQGIAQGDDNIKPFTDVFGNWLKAMRYGYQAEDDAALNAGHAVLQTFLGPEVTREQARNFLSAGMNSTQAALLGFRPQVLVRDALQVLFALPKVGGDLINTIRQFATGGEGAQREIWDWALSRGIAQQNLPNIRAPGYFEGATPVMGGGGAVEGQSLRNRVATSIYENIADRMPSWMRDPSPSNLSPLYWYSRQSEWMRAIVGKAMYDRTGRALVNFAKQGVEGNVEQLLGDSGVRGLDPAYQHVFMQHVASGDHEAAASFAARQMTDGTTFRFGQLESPMVAKTVMGRVGLQFGNYSLQTWQYFSQIARNGTTQEKVKTLLLAGTVTAALMKAQSETGWTFSKLNPYAGVAFAGGPWLETGIDAVKAVGGVANQLANPDAQQPYGTPTIGGVVGSIAQQVNPLGGLWRDAQAIGNATQSPSPGMSLARYATTGQVDNAPDWNNQMAQGAHDAMVQSMQPMSGPVRASAYGSTQVVPNMPVSPPLLTSFPPPSVPVATGQEEQQFMAKLQGVPPDIAQSMLESFRASQQLARSYPQGPQAYGQNAGGRVPQQGPLTGNQTPFSAGIP